MPLSGLLHLAARDWHNRRVPVCVSAGEKDPGPPIRDSGERKRTYRTKKETKKASSITGPIVGALLVIAFVVPMVQYWGYTRKG